MTRVIRELIAAPAGMVMPGAMGMPMAMMCRVPALRGTTIWRGG